MVSLKQVCKALNKHPVGQQSGREWEAAEPFLPQLSDVSSGKMKMDVKKQPGGEAESACLGGEVPGPFQARVPQGSRLLFPRRVKAELPLGGLGLLDPGFTCLCYLPLPIFHICESETLHTVILSQNAIWLRTWILEAHKTCTGLTCLSYGFYCYDKTP